MKAASTPIKEYIIKRLAVNKVTDKLISEKTMDAVISHQFESARNASTRKIKLTWLVA